MLATEEIAAWVGLDWAEDQHEIRLQAAGSREVESYQVRQDPKPCTPGSASYEPALRDGQW